MKSVRFMGRREPIAGFTLVELMAALVLSALLTTAVIGVLKGMVQQRKLLPESHWADGWKLQLKETLHADFAHARRMHSDSQRVILLGYGSRDAANGAVTHRPVEVTYEIEAVAGRAWLTRTEQFVGSQAAPVRELVAHGIARLRVTRMEDEDEPEEELESEASSFYAVPSRLRCRLLDGDGKVVVESGVLQPGKR